jgi:hypothetical protein
MNHMVQQKDTLDWNPQESRKIGRPRRTCKNTTERELQKVEKAGDRQKGKLWMEPNGKAS